ncbi:MAG: cell division FtsZ family protein [Tannerella sp.]|jgi:cell division protein FtsZ|nr:cell division FtsZ family protein [Tannerella sp.]
MDTAIGLNVNIPQQSSSLIKVIGIGGGGVNAVNYMYNKGIGDVSFAAINTDNQPFKRINVPVKILLGKGTGAGGNPDKARELFQTGVKEIEKILNDGSEMVFISCAVGGGTGTGAAPLLARMAKEKDKLTVAVITLPFYFEGEKRIVAALRSVKEMSLIVDALIIVSNETISNMEVEAQEAFLQTNIVLANAVKSIADIINIEGIQNRDFEDVKATMKNSGVALVSYGFGSGDNRVEDAIKDALSSPLLNKNDIHNAARILLYLTFREDAHVKINEITQNVEKFMADYDRRIIMNWGFGIDNSLEEGKELKFTIIATGFGIDAVPDLKQQLLAEAEKQQHPDDVVTEEEIETIGKVYGQKGIAQLISNNPSDLIIVLNDNDLNNIALLEYMALTPPFKRSKKEIEKLRKPVYVSAPVYVSVKKIEPTSAATEDDDPDAISY